MAIIEKVKRIWAKARKYWRKIREWFIELRRELHQEREYWRNIDTSDSRIIVYEKEEFWFDDGNGGRIPFTDERGKPLR